MADKERRFSLAVLVGNALLLLCALMGLAGSFLSLYGGDTMWRNATVLDRCAADGGPLLAWAALAALLSLAAWSLPRFRGGAAGGLAAVWLLALWRNWDAVSTGAVLTCKAIADQFARRVDWGVSFAYESGLSLARETGCTRLFLVFALALLALALGWAVVRARRWWLVLALTLAPLLPGLLADLYPSWPAFMALAACWCAMLLTDLCKWAAPSGRGKLTLTVLPAVAAVLAVISLAFPMEGYTRPPWALKAEEGLTNLANRAGDFFSLWDGPFQRTVTYVGSAEEADLAHAGPLGYSGRTVLRVTSDYDGRLYLRGSSLAVYEDGVWKAVPEGAYEEYCPPGEHAPSPLYFPAMQNQDSPAYTITVNNVGAVGTCVYAPYFPIPQVAEDTGALPVEDAYLARKQGQWKHTLDFVERTPPHYTVLDSGGYVNWDGPYVSFDGPSDGQIAANRYADYAYGHYLDVPEDLQEELDSYVWMWFSSQPSPHSAPGNYDPVLLAQELGAFLSTFCEYDPETPAPRPGVDPVDYFLNESHRGYCMHYASAVALMLRTQGIPARYVSGFTVDSVPDRQVDVPDRAAHAWVEVWLDGFGWYPVEVTPAAAFEWYGQGAAAPDELPTIPPAETEPPEPTPTPSQAPDAGVSAHPSGAPQGPGGADDPQGSGGGGWAVLAGLAKALAVVAGMAALAWLGQFLPKRLRAKKLSGPDRNRAALDGYGYLKRMERWGGRVDGRAVELAQKAKFSRHTLTREELAQLRGFVDAEQERLCVILGPVQRLLFRYLWGMPPRSKKRENAENSAESRD